MGRPTVAALFLSLAVIGGIGCGPDPAEQIRQRSHDFSGHVLNGQTSAALPFVDPDMVKTQGAMITEFKLGATSMFAVGLSKALGKGASLEIGEVKFDAAAESAVCNVYVVDGEGKQIGSPVQQTWVRRDNSWFIRPQMF